MPPPEVVRSALRLSLALAVALALGAVWFYRSGYLPSHRTLPASHEGAEQCAMQFSVQGFDGELSTSNLRDYQDALEQHLAEAIAKNLEFSRAQASGSPGALSREELFELHAKQLVERIRDAQHQLQSVVERARAQGRRLRRVDEQRAIALAAQDERLAGGSSPTRDPNTQDTRPLSKSEPTLDEYEATIGGTVYVVANDDGTTYTTTIPPGYRDLAEYLNAFDKEVTRLDCTVVAVADTCSRLSALSGRFAFDRQANVPGDLRIGSYPQDLASALDPLRAYLRQQELGPSLHHPDRTK